MWPLAVVGDEIDAVQQQRDSGTHALKQLIIQLCDCSWDGRHGQIKKMGEVESHLTLLLGLISSPYRRPKFCLDSAYFTVHWHYIQNNIFKFKPSMKIATGNR